MGIVDPDSLSGTLKSVFDKEDIVYPYSIGDVTIWIISNESPYPFDDRVNKDSFLIDIDLDELIAELQEEIGE